MIATIDHVTEGVSRLLWQYRDKPLFVAFMKTKLAFYQECEDVAQQLLTLWDADTADLVRLRVLAKIVGQFAEGSSEDVFRRFVKARIQKNRSRGTGDRGALRVARILDPQATAIRLYPAGLIVYLNDEWDSIVSDLKIAAAMIRDSTAAGVSVTVIDATDGGTPYLLTDFDTAISGEDDAGTGYSLTPAVGGITAISL